MGSGRRAWIAVGLDEMRVQGSGKGGGWVTFDHAQAGAEDRNKTDPRGDGFGCIAIAQSGFSLVWEVVVSFDLVITMGMRPGDRTLGVEI